MCLMCLLMSANTTASAVSATVIYGKQGCWSVWGQCWPPSTIHSPQLHAAGVSEADSDIRDLLQVPSGGAAAPADKVVSSSDEDTSDEAFAGRHSALEAEEQHRFNSFAGKYLVLSLLMQQHVACWPVCYMIAVLAKRTPSRVTIWVFSGQVYSEFFKAHIYHV